VTAYSTWERPFAPLEPRLCTVANGWFGTELDDERPPVPAGLLVGEQPAPGGRPELPLWPWPERSAGRRLLAMSGLSAGDYLARLARVNMARRPVARWSAKQAEHRAHQLLATLPDGARVVLLGARARDAVPALARLGWFEPALLRVTRGHAVIVSVPHPSGRNREYNDPANRDRAGSVVRWAAGMGELET